MYLLDTNVISELRRVRPHAGVLAWLDSVADSDLHISAVTIGELQAGVEVTRDQDAAKAADLETWIAQIAATYNILPMGAEAFRRWARLMHRQSDDLVEDAMIAATAATHGLTVVTRNVRDFKKLGTPTLNPFEKGRA